MQYADSEWCVLASDDDIYLPGFLNTMISLRDKYPECALFHARSAIIDAADNWLSAGDARLEYETQAQFVYSRGAKRCTQYLPDFMFNARKLQECGGFVDFPLGWYSDDATWFKMAAGGCAHSQDILFLFRWSGENISCRKGDVIPVKLDAGEKYKRWLADFLPTVEAVTKEDALLLRNIKERIFQSVDFHYILQLQHVATLKRLVQTLRKSQIPGRVKRFALFSRLRKLLVPDRVWRFKR